MQRKYNQLGNDVMLTHYYFTSSLNTTAFDSVAILGTSIPQQHQNEQNRCIVFSFGKSYIQRTITHTSNFSSVSFSKYWNLQASMSPMIAIGNSGPEGIAFISDGSLSGIGFTSDESEQPYTSLKGIGGLFFVAHQNGGSIWVFDINPNVNNDFAYVGNYKTARNESCDLAFNRATGLFIIQS